MKTLESLTREDKVACIKNWVEELHQGVIHSDTTQRELLDNYRKLNFDLNAELKDEKVLSNHLHTENISLRSQISELKSSKSPSQEEINKLVNDKITMIFSNPLTYLMSLSESERNEFIGKIYTLITGIKYI